MGSSSIWLNGREPVSSDTSSTEVWRERKLIQMHPSSQCFVCSSFTWFLLVKDSFRQGVVVEACQWFEMADNHPEAVCHSPAGADEVTEVSQEARSCSDTFEHPCVNSVLGKVVLLWWRGEYSTLQDNACLKGLFCTPFQGLHQLTGWYKIFDTV